MTFATIDAIKSLTNRITVTDIASGQTLLTQSGPPAATGQLGVAFSSTTEEGLLLTFRSASEGDYYLTGFTASWRTVCPAAPPAQPPQQAPAGGIAGRGALPPPPPPQLAYSDFGDFSFEGVEFANNTAANGAGGAVAMRVEPGYSATRGAAATFLGGNLTGNVAGRGGALFVTSNLAVRVNGASFVGNTALQDNVRPRLLRPFSPPSLGFTTGLQFLRHGRQL